MSEPEKTKVPFYKRDIPSGYIVLCLLGIVGLVGLCSCSSLGSSTRREREETATETTVGEDETEIPVEEEKVEPEWVEVISLTANADKQSETFQLEGDKQKVSYSTSEGDYGICLIYVMKEGVDLAEVGGVPVVSLEEGMNDETMMRKKEGDYYLDLNVSTISCIVTIYDYK